MYKKHQRKKVATVAAIAILALLASVIAPFLIGIFQ